MPETEECFPRGRAPKPAPGTERKKKLEIDQPEKLFREVYLWNFETFVYHKETLWKFVQTIRKSKKELFF